MASINDVLTETFNSTNPIATTVTSPRVGGGTSLSCSNLAGWPTNTAVHFATYQIDTTGAKVANTQIDWKGIVSGTTIGTLTRKAGATDTGSSIGDVVEMMPTASWGNDLAKWGEVEHSNAGVHALTSNSTITSSKLITGLNDTNANSLVKVSPTSSAVNQFTLANAATGAGPTLSATGSDTNIDINLTPKGTGALKVGGNPIGFGAYTSYTPTFANTTIGAGTVAGKYNQVGKQVNFKARFTLGSGSAVGSSPTVTLPVTAAALISSGTANGDPIGTVSLYDSSATSVWVGLLYATTTGVAVIYTYGASAQTTGLAASTPFVWATGDQIIVSGTYEAA